MRLLVALFCLTTLCDVSTPPSSCPAGCHCLNESDEGQRWKVTCNWDEARFDLFSALPVNVTSSLTIHCSRPLASGLQVERMFKSFGQLRLLRHLAISNCQPANNSARAVLLVGAPARSLPSLRSAQLERLGDSTQIGDKLLDGSSALDKLTITSSGLDAMPSLCHLTELKLLNLSSNRLRNLQWLSMCERNLVVLDVSRNRLAHLSRHQLSTVRNLRVLIAEHNSLQTIAADALDHVDSLHELLLGANQLVSVAKLPSKLVRLDLGANWLSSVPSAIEAMEHGEYLNLSHNRLETFHFDCLRRCASKLRTLDLSANRLALIGLASLTGEMTLRSMDTLSMANNRLERFDLKGLQFPALREFDLSANHLPQLGVAHLNGMPNLRILRVDDNSIGSVEESAFVGTSRLSELSLAGNLLAEVPTAVAALTNLTTLDLSNNRIAAVAKFLFNNMPALSVLNLANNRIVSVDRYVFTNVPALVELNLADNAIAQLAIGSFEGAASLRRLHLQGNSIGDLQGVLVNLSMLEYVNVSSNAIAYLDMGFLPSSLGRLDASRNRLTRVTNFLHRLRPNMALREADLSHNAIHQLSADSLPATLRTVNLSHNAIERVHPRAFYKCAHLDSVDLRANRLHSVDASAFELAPVKEASLESPIPSSVLYLAGNPFRCDCRIGWLNRPLMEGVRMDEGEGRMPTLIDRQQLLCTTGDDQRPIAIAGAPNEVFVCAYDRFCMVDCPCCEFNSCDCNSVCPTDCHCRHDASLTINQVICSGVDAHPKSVPMLATEIRMDGVAVGSGGRRLARNAFLGRHRLRQLYLNASGVSSIDEKAFNDLVALQLLDLSGNRLELLSGAEFYKVPNVTHLFLHNNRLTTVGDYLFAQLTNLRVLTLHGNRLGYLPPKLAFVGGSTMAVSSVTLRENPWKCDCGDHLLLQNWLPRNRDLVPDHELLYCQDDLSAPDNGSTVLRLLPPSKGDRLVKVNFWTFLIDLNRTFCQSLPRRAVDQANNSDYRPLEATIDREGQRQHNLAPLAVVISAGVTVALLGALVGYKLCIRAKRKQCYKKYVGGELSCDNGNYSLPASLLPLQHDILVLCSWEEQRWAEQQLVKRLERELPYHSVCMLYRDLFDDGLPEGRTHQRVADELIAAMERSWRVLAVLSDSFVNNEWQRPAIRIAFDHLLRDRRQRNVVLILPGQLAPGTDPILAHHMRTNRCLQWSDPLFWEKLRDSVPQRVDVDPTPVAAFSESSSSNYADVYGTIVPSHFV
uniref:TIR domain-containing protein n=1 Tax=Trichuris muris TaxID=70415 RepID=A0A5S6QBF4_TRIMR